MNRLLESGNRIKAEVEEINLRFKDVSGEMSASDDRLNKFKKR